MRLKDLPYDFRKQAEKQINCNRTSNCSTDMEQDSCNESLAKEEVEGYDTPCHIHIHSIRKRITDADGVSGKAVIDGLDHAGILKDDSPEYVKEVSYSQEKNKEEKTIIKLTWE